MLAQVNLLPALKQDRLKSQRTRRLVISVGLVVLIILVAVPVLLLLYRSGQSLLLSRTQKSIDANQEKVSNFENIVTMLTVKDNLATLPGLYDQRVYMTQLMAVLPSVTPTEVKFTSLETNSDGSFTISGISSSYAGVQKFFEALKFANVETTAGSIEPDPNQTGHFTNLTLNDVSGRSGDEVTFNVTGSFDTEIINQFKNPSSGGENGQSQ